MLLCISAAATAQINPGVYWTLLPEAQMDEIIGEASGETAWNTIMETGGYNKNRQHEEYEGTFYESQYIYDQLKLYGLPGASIDPFPGREVWDGIKGELWEVSPHRAKLASYRDMTAMLASGSENADVTAELVWVGFGSAEEIERAGVDGKIVVTEGSMSGVHRTACQEHGALGVVAISQSRPHFDPLQIPWSGLRGWRGGDEETKFGFYLTAREGQYLKRRLLNGEKITVHAQVEARMEPYTLQNVTCHIPGTDPDAGEIIFSAHLFEGIVKQGANDNKSGSAGILEVARVLHTLIEEGRLPRPIRTIRFLWGPEFSGTGPWVQAHKELMEKTLCNINMDMVGEWLSKNQAFMCMIRTTYGHAHYINDVMENYYRFVGETSVERIHNRGRYPTPERIVAPTGADEPFYYSIETHYGASDHEVFNDWGVGVPGIMMIAWPDQWYHTSGDRVDKADPTQMKRVAVIGAAGAYTIANADDRMVIRIAGEIAANATRRMGIQFALAQKKLDDSEAAGLADAFKSAVNLVTQAALADQATLESVFELSRAKAVTGYVAAMKTSINGILKTHTYALEQLMKTRAGELGRAPVKIVLTDLEKRAAGIVPKPTPKVTENGYGGYQELIMKAAGGDNENGGNRRRMFSRFRGIGDSSELHRLINGTRSLLDIKNAMDAQSERETDLESMIDYIDILGKAGLVTL
ncbi:M28 family peptidase [bacterium]|nr:M28 family peptidase [bacterium]